VRFVFDCKVVLNWEFSEKARICHIVFETTAVKSDGKEARLKLIVFIKVFSK